MPRPKFKIGEFVRIESDRLPMFNSERERVISGRWCRHENCFIYCVTNTPKMVRETSLRKLDSKPLTNEEIYIIFLKKHRKFSSFKRQRYQGFRAVIKVTNVKNAVDRSMLWDTTKEGDDFWMSLEEKWQDLCDKFKLKGQIHLDLVK